MQRQQRVRWHGVWSNYTARCFRRRHSTWTRASCGCARSRQPITGSSSIVRWLVSIRGSMSRIRSSTTCFACWEAPADSPWARQPPSPSRRPRSSPRRRLRLRSCRAYQLPARWPQAAPAASSRAAAAVGAARAGAGAGLLRWAMGVAICHEGRPGAAAHAAPRRRAHRWVAPPSRVSGYLRRASAAQPPPVGRAVAAAPPHDHSCSTHSQGATA